MKLKSRAGYRKRRHNRVRRKISGTANRPRMAIMKSNRCLFVQFIDDDHGVTLAAANTRNSGDRKNLDGARHLGRQAAATAIEKGIREVVVDRGGFRYHGCIRAIVEGALEGGLRSGAAAVEATKLSAPAEEVS